MQECNWLAIWLNQGYVRASKTGSPFLFLCNNFSLFSGIISMVFHSPLCKNNSPLRAYERLRPAGRGLPSGAVKKSPPAAASRHSAFCTGRASISSTNQLPIGVRIFLTALVLRPPW